MVHEYTDELAVVGAMVVGVALIATGDNTNGFALAALALGYAFGRVKKINGDMKNYINR